MAWGLSTSSPERRDLWVRPDEARLKDMVAEVATDSLSLTKPLLLNSTIDTTEVERLPHSGVASLARRVAVETKTKKISKW